MESRAFILTKKWQKIGSVTKSNSENATANGSEWNEYVNDELTSHLLGGYGFLNNSWAEKLCCPGVSCTPTPSKGPHP
jgi:hypothetical protein